MPGLVTMKPGLKSRGSASKALARAREERGLGALLSQVRVSPAKKGRRPADVHSPGVLTRSNLAMRLRMKLLGEVGDVESFDREDVSSGSEHEPSSVCLAAMVDEFLEEEATEFKNTRCRFNFEDGVSTGDDDSRSSVIEELAAVLHSSADNVPERILLGEVRAVVAGATRVGAHETSSLKRLVMKHLCRSGFDAGICKSRWDHSGGFPGGDHEYIDVVFEGSTGRHERIVIDIDFNAQFEIARPTAHYDALVRALPSIFVGRGDQLQWIVNVMSEAVKLSLKKRGMHLPPWRKPEYMRAKWFSAYKRTTKDIWDMVHEVPDRSVVALVSGHGVGGGESLRMVARVPKHQKPVELHLERRKELGTALGNINNNDWQPPLLKAKKCEAGVSRLREGSLSASMKNLCRNPYPEGKGLLMAASGLVLS